MEKQEAIDFILLKWQNNENQIEITSELSQKLGVPSEIVAKFVQRVINQCVTVEKAASVPTQIKIESVEASTISTHPDIGTFPENPREPAKTRIFLPQMERSLAPVHAGDRYRIWLQTFNKRTKENWKIFSRNRFAMLGLILLSLYLIMALLHPILLKTIWSKSVYDPVTGYDMKIYLHPSGISKAHLLGTDTLGRDVLSIMMAATRPCLSMAIVTTITATLLGTFIGAISAFYRGAIDGFFTSLADLSLLAPAPLIMVIIGFVLDIDPLRFGLIYGLLAGIGVVAIVLRSHALTVVSKSYIQAAQVAGGGSFHILTNHVIPHLLPLAAVNMLFTVTGAIFASGFIAFLGLSRAQLNWGSMIYDAFTYEGINGILPWNVLIPSAMAISLFAASFYLIALGLRDVVEPRLAESKIQRIS